MMRIAEELIWWRRGARGRPLGTTDFIFGGASKLDSKALKSRRSNNGLYFL
jgi:hypothetical protein